MGRGRGGTGSRPIRAKLPALPSRADVRREEKGWRAMPIHDALREWTMQIPRRRIHWPSLARRPRAIDGEPQIGSLETRELMELKKYRDCLRIPRAWSPLPVWLRMQPAASQLQLGMCLMESFFPASFFCSFIHCGLHEPVHRILKSRSDDRVWIIRDACSI